MKAARVSSRVPVLLAVLAALSLATTSARAATGVCESLSGGAVEMESAANPTPTGYATLGAAFADINNGVYTGTIAIDVCGDTTEPASAVLNASGSGSASYTGVAIAPAGGAARTISGALNGALIDLNGAGGVVLDGLNSGGDALTIDNASTGTSAATIRFIADASSDTVRNCTIKGATTGATSGTIVFATGTVTGNTGDTITANTITSSGATLPVNAIYSAGSSTSVANTGIAITNNRIQDYFSAGAASNGIFVASNSASFTISGNKFFQTATRTLTTAAAHRAINIVTPSGGGYTVSNNTVGYASASATGTTSYTGTVAGQFRGIELTVANAPASEIQGNTVTAITLATTAATPASVTGPGVFAGISVLAGSVNIGTSTGNTIGATTATGAISVTSTVTAGVTEGIYATSTGTIAVQNNNVGGITAANTTTATIGFVVRGIDTWGVGGNVTASGNTIGSTTVANSIQVGATSVQTTAVTSFYGIANTATGTIAITGNTIQNCTTFGTGADLFFGINNAGAGAGTTVNLTGNSVISGSSKGTGTSNGIVSSAAAGTVNANNNTVRGMSWNPNTGAGTFRAIEVNGAVTAAINLNDNVLGDATAGLMSYGSTVTSGTLVGIYGNGGAATAALSIQRNDIRGISYAGTAATNEIDCFYVGSSASDLTQTIKDNTVTNLNVNTSGSVYMVRSSGNLPASGTQTVTNNRVVGTFTDVKAGAIVYGFNNSGFGAATAAMTQSNNNFSNITVTGNSTLTCIDSSDSAPRTIQGNVCNNWTGGASGSLIGIRLRGITGGAPATVTGNTITNFTSAGGQTGIQVDGSAPTATISANAINTLTTSGTAITGILVNAASSGNTNNVFVTSNTVSGLNSSGGGVAGITMGGVVVAGTLNATASLNVISGLSSTFAGSSIFGISSGASVTTANVFRNKVYDISFGPATAATASIFALSAGGFTNTFSNNLVGDLRAPAASNAGTPSIVGLTASGTAGVVNFVNNTVYIAGTSTGSPFSTASVFAGTGPNLILRNNVLVNAATPTGTGLAIAIYRPYIPLFNYDLSSNNNDLYASTAYYDGVTVAPTLSDLWAIVYPRESNSFSENPAFQSTVGTDPGFLHIVLASTTLLESRGVNFAGITDDYDTDIRQGNPGYAGTGTAPDVGADEFEGTAIGDVAPPAIVYPVLGAGAPSTSRVFAATIADATGVATLAGVRPRVYFKKSTDVNDPTGWKYTEAIGSGGSPFDFTIDYTALNAGSVSVGDVIQYFVVAQDTVGTPNVGLFQGAFAAPPASVGLTAAAFPIGGAVNSYTITTAASGALTVCPSGCDFLSLTNSGGLFEALNARVFTGNVTVDILGDSTAETGAVALNQWPEDPAGNYTLTIRPGGGAARTVSGSFAGGLIRLNGADRVTIDGLNTDGNSLTVSNASITNPSTAIHLTSTGLLNLGATNNTIRNLNIVGGANTVGISGIALAGNIANAPAADNDGNTISGNTITRVYYAIYVRGSTTPPSAAMDNLVIENNTLGPVSQGTDSLGIAGIYMYGANSPQVQGNTIRNLTAGASSSGGIYLVQEVNGGSIKNNTITNITSAINSGGTSSITGVYLGTLVTGVTVSGNKIQSVSNTNGTGFGARGIIVNTSELTAGITTIANNMISDIFSVANTANSTWPMGIQVDAATNPVRIYDNSVNLYGPHPGINAASSSAALYLGGSITGTVDVRDNIFANSYDNSTSVTDKNFAVQAQNFFGTFTDINHNDYYVNGPLPANNFIGNLQSSTGISTLAGWRTATTKDANSIAANPLFVSATDLHLNRAGICAKSPAENAGTSIAGVINDVDGDTRSATPDIGADEVTDITACNDANDCTYSDACTGPGVCGGTSITCASDTCATRTCNGTSSCTVSAAASGTTCGVGGSQCKNQDTCDGLGSCVDQGFKPATETCLGTSTGSVCDNDGADHCSGISAACVDAYLGSETTCRAAVNACDVAETCSGTSGACLTPDAFASAATNCNFGTSTGGACDGADHCDGNAATCVDAYLGSETTCRAAVNACDVAEVCGGTSGECLAPDAFASATTSCNFGTSTGGTCDGADHCDGNAATCVDAYLGSETTCRAAVNACDLAEVCSGTSGACLAPDAVASAATSCNFGTSTGSVCDNDGADHCDGTSATCVDAYLGSETTCRAAVNACDVAEVCSGTSGTCLAPDEFASASTNCTFGSSDGGACDGADHCDGSAATCVDVYLGSETTCRAAVNACDVAEVCGGTSGSCLAPDAFASAATSCNFGTSDGGACDGADHCDGSAATCVDVYLGSETTCRAAVNACDVAEVCSGTSGTCLAPDAFAPASTSCNFGVSTGGVCDADGSDHCDGTSAACLDAYQPTTFQCRASTVVCDPAEFCTGTSATCPNDAINQSDPVGATLRVNYNKPTHTSTLSWTEAIPGPFNVYRGSLTAGTAFAYNQSCFDYAVPGASSTDMLTPRPGRLFFYLVSRKQVPCSESNVGQDSLGADRPNPLVCPMSPPDADADGFQDSFDNCPANYNPSQSDVDADNRGDACDNCVNVYNPDQANSGGDPALGDACDPDMDGDGVPNGVDNCPTVPNSDQLDTDMNGIGDACQ